MSNLDTISAYRIPLSEHIFHLLRRRIISLQAGYQPGAQLSSEAIARELGVSRTPVSLAFQRLMYDGLVIVEPRKGTFVRALSHEEIHELFELLGQLEAVSVRVSSGKFPDSILQKMNEVVDEAERQFQTQDLEAYLEEDLAFHREIGCLSPNTKLCEAYTTTQNQIYLASAVKAVTPGDASAAVSQHRALIEIFRSGEVQLITDSVVDHWRESYRRYCIAHENQRRLSSQAPLSVVAQQMPNRG